MSGMFFVQTNKAVTWHERHHWGGWSSVHTSFLHKHCWKHSYPVFLICHLFLNWMFSVHHLCLLYFLSVDLVDLVGHANQGDNWSLTRFSVFDNWFLVLPLCFTFRSLNRWNNPNLQQKYQPTCRRYPWCQHLLISLQTQKSQTAVRNTIFFFSDIVCI